MALTSIKYYFFSLFLLLFFAAQNTFAQNPDIKRTWHWYFGHQCGLDFSSGVPVVDTNSQLNTIEGCSVISDTSGNLLFYTDGDTVWNKLHQPMPNGIGLLGCGNYESSSQTGLIVPYPAHDSLFYIFTTDCIENNFASGFTYSVVNMNLDNGNGSVYIKNQLLMQNGTEGIAVTKHSNGTDYWLINHELFNNNYVVYQITSSGISAPLIQAFGQNVLNEYSYLRFSGDGTLLAGSFEAIYGQLLHFNNSNGLLSDLVLLNYGFGYSPEFSPDNSKLYAWDGGNVINQYCLTNYDSLSINNSHVSLFFPVDNDVFGAIQKAPDGKLYIASLYGNYDSISVINNPNNYGYACNISVLSLYPGGKSMTGLPNFVSAYLDFNQVPAVCDSTVGIANNNPYDLLIFPNPASDYITIKNFVSGNKQLFIYNYSGQMIFQKETKESSLKIDISNYAESLYLLKVQSENKIITKKFFIKR